MLGTLGWSCAKCAAATSALEGDASTVFLVFAGCPVAAAGTAAVASVVPGIASIIGMLPAATLAGALGEFLGVSASIAGLAGHDGRALGTAGRLASLNSRMLADRNT